MDNTGVDSPDYGESVYIGSAQSNWETHSGGEPDNSDRNQIIANTVVDTAAENIDIKEGSSDGVVPGNYLGGDKIASKNSADSWIEIKGNGYLIDSNHGVTTQGWSASHRTERETNERHRVSSQTWLVRIGHTGHANGPRTDVRGPFR